MSYSQLKRLSIIACFAILCKTSIICAVDDDHKYSSDYRDMINGIAPLFKPIQWRKDIPVVARGEPLQMLCLKLALPSHFTPITLMEERLNKQYIQLELKIDTLNKPSNRVLVTLDLMHAELANFFTPAGMGGPSNFEPILWDIVSKETSLYPSDVASLVIFEGLEKSGHNLEEMPFKKLQSLAAKVRARQNRLGFYDVKIFQTVACTVVLFNMFGEGELGVVMGYLFDASGTYRGDLKINAPIDFIKNDDLVFVRTLIGGMSLENSERVNKIDKDK